MKLSLVWLGLYLSLNHTTPINAPLEPTLAAQATAIVGVGRFTVTGIFIQPVERRTKPLVSVGIGIRVF